jgi:phosphoribosylglycinamide formyltransferase-1
MNRPRIAVLASGRGSNMEAIADACADGRITADLALVLANNAHAGVLVSAAQRGLPHACIEHGEFADREAFERAMLAELRAQNIDIVVLAGFMRILTPLFIREYYGSLLNIHPSLLPKYPGLHTHQRALDAGDREAGATVHFVIPELDAGPAIIQARVAIHDGDRAEDIAARVQREEHRIYPLAVQWCATGRVVLKNGIALKDGEAISVETNNTTSTAVERS